MTKLVKDLMHPGIITCKPTATLGQVAVLLNQHQVHALFVTDRDGRILGLISDFDLMAGEWLSSDSESLTAMRKLTAADLMTRPIDSVEASIPLSEAVDQFIEKGISRLLVTENEKPVGIISLSDFVASIANEIKSKRETVGDVMSHAILVCRGKTPVASAARAMTSAGWRSVLVVDIKGKILGVVSGYDLLRFVKEGVDENLVVRDVMHPALTIDRQASLREAADMLIQNHHHRLVVIDKDDPDSFPIGALSTFDIVAEMARPDSVWQK
ncbi:MAG: CBS domain-containing protein [Anaerolineales bacterium]|uniref:CBS domain-containing protein n=1 Tax=Candidatus Villigracilis proximus TaxID=3140683 RepID=UPI00313563D5|nr:CBS domain-containing protein [Anaerolineales bacterium]